MFEKVHEAIGMYKNLWNPEIEQVEVSEAYALEPDKSAKEVTLHWPKEWPHSKRAGVYLVFSGDGDVLYIGKSWTIGERLSNHFKVSPTGACISPEGYHWSKPPVYLITVAVPKARRFETSCLEEFLIEKFPESDNMRK